MKTILFIAVVMLLRHTTYASDSTDFLAEALRKVYGGEVNGSFLDAGKKSPDGFIVEYTRAVGDGGYEEFEVFYRKNGTLAVVKSKFEYRAHSMGPGNRHFITRTRRFFDETGKLTKADGHTKSTFLINGKVDENRKIISKDDVVIKEQATEVLMSLDAQIIKQLNSHAGKK